MGRDGSSGGEVLVSLDSLGNGSSLRGDGLRMVFELGFVRGIGVEFLS